MPRPAPLVCEHLENVSRRALENYQHLIRNYVRKRHGVYALYRKKRLYYVGLASNLRTRLGHHLKDHHGDSWDRFSVYLTIDHRHLREMESLTQRIASPAGNKQRGKFAKSTDLRTKFRKDMKESWDLELQEMFGIAARELPTLKP